MEDILSITSVIGFLISLTFCALFSFLETSITALRLYQLKELSKSNSRYKNLFNVLEKNPHRILITILIVNSLANATTAGIITHIMENIFAKMNLSESLGFSIGIFIATLAILIFGEIIPKHFAKYHGERFLQSTLWIANLVVNLLYPFVHLLTKISDFITYKIGKKEKNMSEPSENEIQFLINYINEQGIIDSDKTMMLQNIFKLGKKLVREIMIPEINMIKVDANLDLNNNLEFFTKNQFSKYPVFENDPDNIVGLIYQKNVFQVIQYNNNLKVINLIKPIIFVPESLKIIQLLGKFKEHQIHMAIVLNEFGGISGLVTLHDVIKEIVGEISDANKIISKKVISIKENEWLVDAAIPLDNLGDFFNITFESKNVITLGGFLTEKLQNLPKYGDQILYKNYSFQIQKASPKKVLQVRVSKEAENRPFA